MVPRWRRRESGSSMPGMNRLALLLLLTFAFHAWRCASQTTSPRWEENSIRLGAVLSKTGKTFEMQEARMGYELFVDIANRNGGANVRGLDESYQFKFDFQWADDKSDQDKHTRLFTKLLEKDKVHFAFGSHPEYAVNETSIAHREGRINYQCCVGPDNVYDKGYQEVFGVQASNKEYTILAVQSMFLKRLKALGVIYRGDNLFTKSTCEAALKFVAGVQEYSSFSLVLTQNYTLDESVNPATFETFVRKAKEKNVEAVVACSFGGDGKLLVEAFHNAEYPLKALFLTVGPTKKDWVEQFPPPQADYILSAGQWHNSVKYGDTFFGNTGEYQRQFKALHNDKEPTYVAAGASAVGYTTLLAIENAFKDCYINQTEGKIEKLLFDEGSVVCEDGKGITGYERIRLALKELDVPTFFGRVKFNANQRNIGLDPATTQVFPVEGSNPTIKAVLPVGAANADLVMPGKNPYKPECPKGTYVGPDEFDPCIPCKQGSISEKPNAPDCDKCPTGSYMDKEGQSSCDQCPWGTTTDGRGAENQEECVCKEGYYRPGQEPGQECFLCPSGAECMGNTTLPVALEGYWTNEEQLQIYECERQDVCRGGAPAICKTGYTGRLCSECAKGYFNVFEQCQKCLHKGILVCAIVALVIGWYILNMVISQNVPSLEMVLSWAQLANVIGDVNLQWPATLEIMFGVANLLDFDVDILQPSCLVNWSFTQNFIVQLLLPFLMSLMAVFGYSMSSILLKLHKMGLNCVKNFKQWFGWLIEFPENEKQLARKWDGTVATFLASVEVTYITVAKYCFDVFPCREIGGVSVLATSPDIECNSRQHKLLIGLGVFGTVFYSLGYLAFVSWKMYQMYQERSFSDPGNIRRYGFLYKRYEVEYIWTPIVVLLRRLLFIVILVFLKNPAFQAGALAAIINMSIMLHVYTAPYVDTYLDVMFGLLLVVLVMEAFGGIMFYAENLPNANREILEVILLLGTLILVVVFVMMFAMEMRRKLHQWNVQKLHKEAILQRRHSDLEKANRPRQRQKSILPMFTFSRGVRREVSHELLETFDPGFLSKALTKRPDYIHDWDALTNMLKAFVCDQSETSYLSREPVAKFWRKLVDRFPELVDFLAIADSETRTHFNEFANTLYRHFYLTNKVQKLPIFGVLNWRDRAPMAQWLAMTNQDDRVFFTRFMANLFREVEGPETAEMLEKEMESGGSLKYEILRMSKQSSGKKETQAQVELQSGRGPFDHSAHKKMRAATNAVRGVVRMGRLAGATQRILKLEMSKASGEKSSELSLALEDGNMPQVNELNGASEIQPVDVGAQGPGADGFEFGSVEEASGEVHGRSPLFEFARTEASASFKTDYTSMSNDREETLATPSGKNLGGLDYRYGSGKGMVYEESDEKPEQPQGGGVDEEREDVEDDV